MKEPIRINYDNGYFVGEVEFVYEKDGIQYYIREGKGEMIYDNGMRKIGTWQKDKMEGTGMVIFKNGDVYEGEFKRGYKHGNGLYKFSSTGNVYKVVMNYDKLVSKEFDHNDNKLVHKVVDIELRR